MKQYATFTYPQYVLMREHCVALNIVEGMKLCLSLEEARMLRVRIAATEGTEQDTRPASREAIVRKLIALELRALGSQAEHMEVKQHAA